MKKIIIGIFVSIITLPAMAITVTGRVVDDKTNEPLIGASVVLGTTGVGAAADLNGDFTLEDNRVQSNSELQISYVGYKTITVKAAENIGTIKLQEEASTIDEVVVTGQKLDGKPCGEQALKKVDPNATSGKWEQQNGKNICKIEKCADGYGVNKKTNTCFKSEQCSQAQLLVAFAKTGHTDIDKDGNVYCVPDTCDTPLYEKVGDKCESITGKKCKNLPQHAQSGERGVLNGHEVCIVKCKDGYLPNDDSTACDESDGPCTEEQIKQIEHATKGEMKKGVCQATECEDKYKPKKGKCVLETTAPQKSPEEQKEQDPKLSPEDQKNKEADLKDNYQKMKDKEQSQAARMTSGAAIGAMGIGAMEALSAKAEQKADDEAERDMKAYLETFRCDYGQGRNIKGGEKEITVPGANSLTKMVMEYTKLADDLKVRKTALGMRPGIESEHVIAAADTGLYDNAALGKTGGKYTSLSRALTDKDSEDAAEWAAQKDKTAKKLKTGAVVAGVGALVGIAGNIAVGAKGPKNEADKINNKYDNLKKMVEEADKEQAALPQAKCSDTSGITGTWPDCICTDTTKYFSANQGCIACGVTGQTYNKTSGKCECPSDKPVIENSACVASKPDCKLTGLKNKDTCACIANAIENSANECVCDEANGYKLNDKNICEKEPEKPASAVPPNPLTSLLTGGGEQIKIFDFTYDSDKLFALGSATLKDNDAKKFIADFNTKLTAEAQKDSIDLSTAEYCANIVGHTDKSGGDKVNIPLSQKRAETIKNLLSQSDKPLKASNIQTSGKGSAECQQNHDPKCRKVTLTITTGKCTAQGQ